MTLVRALCALVAIASSEALVDDKRPMLEQELLKLAIGLGISFGLAGIIGLFWPLAV